MAPEFSAHASGRQPLSAAISWHWSANEPMIASIAHRSPLPRVLRSSRLVRSGGTLAGPAIEQAVASEFCTHRDKALPACAAHMFIKQRAFAGSELHTHRRRPPSGRVGFAVAVDGPGRGRHGRPGSRDRPRLGHVVRRAVPRHRGTAGSGLRTDARRPRGPAADADPRGHDRDAARPDHPLRRAGQAAGVDATLVDLPTMWHSGHVLAGLLRESTVAVRDLGHLPAYPPRRRRSRPARCRSGQLEAPRGQLEARGRLR